MIEEAEGLLYRASAMGTIGRFQLEAAIQSAHVVRRRSGASDWSAIERLYDALAAITAFGAANLVKSPARANKRRTESSESKRAA